MCGILCIFDASSNNTTTNHLHHQQPGLLKHRGPDEFKTHQSADGRCYMEFTRLSINDVSTDGSQPFIDPEEGKTSLMCNGEVYNHKELYHHQVNSKVDAASDCACLIPLIQQHGIEIVSNLIRGVFAICYYDGTKLLATRDPYGVRPLFYTRNGTVIAFSSEMKVLHANFEGSKVHIFPPGHFYDSKLDQFICYYQTYWWYNPSSVSHSNVIRDVFTEAVSRRVSNTERPVGYFLSGGLDSSLVTAIGSRLTPPGTKLKTFSIGLGPDTPDCKAARTMAKWINSDHTEVHFTPAEGIKNLRNVIRSLESYDTTTIRASVPMWLLSKYISENTDCKVILSGEGSDELFGGYLYFKNAPSTEDFFYENTRRIRLLHQYDVLRADRCTAAHGLEVRVPFLDRDLVDHVMTIDQRLKFKKGDIEKWILRSEFTGGDLLPLDILWRQKDAFSDAVGHSWVDKIKGYADIFVTDQMFEDIKVKAGDHNTPTTKEEALYRHLFWDIFGVGVHDHLISEIWRPRWTDETDPDPSARYLNNTQAI